MVEKQVEQISFEGEDANSGYGSPSLDLISSLILTIVAIAFIVGALGLPVPGDKNTAPGLLPFIVATSLLLMTLGLAASAIARARSGQDISIFADRDISTDLRSILLASAVAIYILALQEFAFQRNFSAFGTNLRLTAFEPVTIIALTTIVYLNWRGPLWIVLSICCAWTIALSLVFQLVFRIPLPGTF